MLAGSGDAVTNGKISRAILRHAGYEAVVSIAWINRAGVEQGRSAAELIPANAGLREAPAAHLHIVAYQIALIRRRVGKSPISEPVHKSITDRINEIAGGARGRFGHAHSICGRGNVVAAGNVRRNSHLFWSGEAGLRRRGPVHVKLPEVQQA